MIPLQPNLPQQTPPRLSKTTKSSSNLSTSTEPDDIHLETGQRRARTILGISGLVDKLHAIPAVTSNPEVLVLLYRVKLELLADELMDFLDERVEPCEAAGITALNELLNDFHTQLGTIEKRLNMPDRLGGDDLLIEDLRKLGAEIKKCAAPFKD